MHHLLQAAIAPVLVLLEVGGETAAGDAGEPGCPHRLHGLTQQQGREVEAQGRADQAQPPLDHPQAGQGAPNREGQLLGCGLREAHPVDAANLDHHLGVHGRRAKQVHHGQGRDHQHPGADPHVAIDNSLGVAKPLLPQ